MQTATAHRYVGNPSSEREVRRDKPQNIRAASGDGGADAGGAPKQYGREGKSRRVCRYVGVAVGRRSTTGQGIAGPHGREA